MNATSSKLLPAPPKLISSFLAGFDTITTHIMLILFPLSLDLLLWLGPRLKITRLVEAAIAWMSALPSVESPETAEMLRANQESLRLLGERFNLFSALRSYPVGIPSLMASRLPGENPGSFTLASLDLPSFGVLLAGGILLSLLGYGIGALYFHAVAEASLSGRVRWNHILRTWPRSSLQSVLLALCWLALIVAVTIPASCMILVINLTSPSFARIFLLLYGGFLVWMLFPLFFSPHGIFVNGNNVFTALKQSMFITRMTLPTTGIFFLMILIIGQGLDVLWQMPNENSWLTLVGIAGHAFVVTGLLASSFIYYKEADRWMQSMRAQWRKPSQSELRP